MAKQFKINIKNTQLAEAIHLSEIKKKIASKKQLKAEEPAPEEEPPKEEASPIESPVLGEDGLSEAPKIKARSRSVFEGHKAHPGGKGEEGQKEEVKEEAPQPQEVVEKHPPKTPLQIAEEKFSHVETAPSAPSTSKEIEKEIAVDKTITTPIPTPQKEAPKAPQPRAPLFRSPRRDEQREAQAPRQEGKPQPQGLRGPPRTYVSPFSLPKKASPEGLAKLQASQKEKLGPTGRHISDFVKPPPPPARHTPTQTTAATGDRPRRPLSTTTTDSSADKKSGGGPKPPKKDFKDFKPAAKKLETPTSFDGRDRQGLRADADEGAARRRRKAKAGKSARDDVATVRPTTLKIRVPISIKDFASELKLKASELIAKLFLQGSVMTLNDLLDDETTIQLLGQEYGCEITIDTTQEARIRITDRTIREEIKGETDEKLILRPPVVTFMGHVDHGKTSLIDAIRKSNRVSQEAGAITQHIGAFKCSTAVGDITILDTPGHEAFSAMRARGAEVTDIVVLVVAGDEGMRQQTLEALQHAKSAGVTIVVAINKSDKPNFNAETVYRQLAENNLLPEVWGGQTITINCSAVTGEGIPQLLEMLALQAEVLELRANPDARARGTVIESEMHKGLGIVATILVQNGTLRKGDAVVFDTEWAKVKTMRDELGRDLASAPPSTPVLMTGLSALPKAGQEFIVVKDEKEAREIAETRSVEKREKSQLTKRSMDSFLQQAQGAGKKILRLVLRADVQGSLEALKSALLKITSNKVDIDIVFTGVGEISESDIQLAAASKAVIIGFHNSIESHAEDLAKELTVEVRLHDIIYHAIDDVKVLMAGQLEKLAQEVVRGSATVLQTFKSSHVGIIAGCIVNDGAVHRNYKVNLKRKGAVIWRGGISSLKRLKDDVREVVKGLECGIVLDGFNDAQPDDILEFYEIIYITQEL